MEPDENFLAKKKTQKIPKKPKQKTIWNIICMKLEKTKQTRVGGCGLELGSVTQMASVGQGIKEPRSLPMKSFTGGKILGKLSLSAQPFCAKPSF